MWAAGSDRNLKTNIREVDTAELLHKVSSLPVYRWSYKAQDESIEHIGPMAQDFYKTFQIGDNEKSIGTLDPAGVALAAIKQLHKENRELKKELNELKQQLESNNKLAEQVERLSQLVNEINSKEATTAPDNFVVLE